MKCLNCNIEFEAKRADAKFHSSACKMAYNRNIKRNKPVTDNKINVTSVTDNPSKSVTDKLNVTVEPVSVTKSKISVTDEAKSVTERVKTSNGVVIVTLHKDGRVFENDTLIPEEELNSFYRGKRGKLELSQDISYSEMYSVVPVILRETDRNRIVQEKYRKASGL